MWEFFLNKKLPYAIKYYAHEPERELSVQASGRYKYLAAFILNEKYSSDTASICYTSYSLPLSLFSLSLSLFLSYSLINTHTYILTRKRDVPCGIIVAPQSRERAPNILWPRLFPCDGRTAGMSSRFPLSHHNRFNVGSCASIRWTHVRTTSDSGLV